MQHKKQIIIIESAPSDTLTKIAKILKKKGYETVIITLMSNIEAELLKESYDKIVSFNAKFFKINLNNSLKIFLHGFKNIFKILNAFYQIRKLKPEAIIGRATPNWLCALFRIYFKKSIFIYFPYDIRSFSFKNLQEAKNCKIPLFEIMAESYCFEHADGIIHKGGQDELKQLNKNVLGDINVQQKSLYFFPYCLKEFMVPINKKEKLSRRDKNIHTVYVGHVPNDIDWIEGIKSLIKQKIYLHLYSRTANLTKEEEEERISGFLKPFLKSKFLIIHEAVNQKELSKEIAKYDYGFYSYCSSIKRGYDNATGNKIASYLEAGLPIICPSFYTTAAKILEAQGVGVVFPYKKFGSLKNILKKNKPERFYKNILKTRNFLSMENQILRLEKFIEEIKSS